MQLSVRPDDLVTTAGAVRSLHGSVADDRHEFAAVAARMTDRLGARAVDSAARTVAAVVAALEGVEADLATLARGLTAIATGYAHVDGRRSPG